MAEYHRILSYLYRYDKKIKMDCKGFVKAEQKRSGLKINLQIDDDRLMEDIKLALCFYGKYDDTWEMQRLAMLKTTRHHEEMTSFISTEQLPAGFDIRNKYGVILFYQESFYYGSVWIGDEIPIDELWKIYESEFIEDSNMDGEESVEVPEVDKGKSVEVPRVDKEESTVVLKVDKGKSVEIRNVEDEELIEVSNVAGGKSIQIPNMDTEKSVEDSNIDVKENPVEESRQEVDLDEVSVQLEEKQEKVNEIVDRKLKEESEREDEKTKEMTETSDEYEKGRNEKGLEWKNDNIEGESGKKSSEEIRQRMTNRYKEYSKDDLSEKSDGNSELEEKDSELSTKSQDKFKKMWITSLKNVKPVDNIFNPAFHGGYQIEAEQLESLCPEAGLLKNNQFLVKGYQTYHHLLAGKVMYAGEERYCIGVPGIYENRERYMAQIYQFPIFLSMTENRIKTGGFGYWLHLM